MSAFVVGHAHINAMLTYAIKQRVSYYIENQGSTVITAANATEIGKLLLTENVRSVKHRYNDCTDDDLPGTIGESVDSYNYKRVNDNQHPVIVLKFCDCFDYQACETDDYEQSVAHKIVDNIRSTAIRALPGYDKAPWGA